MLPIFDVHAMHGRDPRMLCSRVVARATHANYLSLTFRQRYDVLSTVHAVQRQGWRGPT